MVDLWGFLVMKPMYRYFYQSSSRDDSNKDISNRDCSNKNLLWNVGRSAIVSSLVGGLWFGWMEIIATRFAVAEPAISQNNEEINEEVNEEANEEIPASPDVSAEEIATALLGRWEGESNAGSKIVFEFVDGGQLFVRFPAPPNEQQGSSLEFSYTINTDRSLDPEIPIPLDINGVSVPGIESKTVLTIFEFTNESRSQMLLQLSGTNPGLPRPSQFENPTFFQKVRDNASDSSPTAQPLDTLPQTPTLEAR